METGTTLGRFQLWRGVLLTETQTDQLSNINGGDRAGVFIVGLPGGLVFMGFGRGQQGGNDCCSELSGRPSTAAEIALAADALRGLTTRVCLKSGVRVQAGTYLLDLHAPGVRVLRQPPDEPDLAAFFSHRRALRAEQAQIDRDLAAQRRKDAADGKFNRPRVRRYNPKSRR